MGRGEHLGFVLLTDSRQRGREGAPGGPEEGRSVWSVLSAGLRPWLTAQASQWPRVPRLPRPSRCAFCMCSVHLLLVSSCLGLRPRLSGFWLGLSAGKSPLSASQLPTLLLLSVLWCMDPSPVSPAQTHSCHPRCWELPSPLASRPCVYCDPTQLESLASVWVGGRRGVHPSFPSTAC